MDGLTYEAYFEQFVVISDQGSAVCLLCPSTISSQKAITSTSAAMVSHFEKLHKPKVGNVYCNYCCKNIGQVGQGEQVEQHNGSAKHEAAVARAGTNFRYCKTCGAVNPPSSHNKVHKIVPHQYVKPEEGIVKVDQGTKDRFAQSVLSYVYKNKHHQLSIGVWCNEHFQKIFGYDFDHAPVPITVGENRNECRVCKSISAIWGNTTIMQGKLITVNEEDYRKYVVGQVVQQYELEDEILPAQYAELDDDVQDMYFWRKESKTFVLTRNKAKAAVAKNFLQTGATPKHSDQTDGANHQEDVQQDTSLLE